MNIRAFTLRQMLAAAEATMDQTAKDDAERARIRAELYAPPARERRRRTRDGDRGRPTGGGMSMRDAQQMMAQLAAQDAQLAGGRSG
ncbi:hypothetical protein PV341_07780 [Streptomyces sp. PA03-1a]|nr:hypothetical protein [Streptomyces sp. PA03-1a]